MNNNIYEKIRDTNGKLIYIENRRSKSWHVKDCNTNNEWSMCDNRLYMRTRNPLGIFRWEETFIKEP